MDVDRDGVMSLADGGVVIVQAQKLQVYEIWVKFFVKNRLLLSVVIHAKGVTV